MCFVGGWGAMGYCGDFFMEAFSSKTYLTFTFKVYLTFSTKFT
jgi:hypothetical protein